MHLCVCTQSFLRAYPSNYILSDFGSDLKNVIFFAYSHFTFLRNNIVSTIVLKKNGGALSLLSPEKVGVGIFRRGLIRQSQDHQGLANYTGSTFWALANVISLNS